MKNYKLNYVHNNIVLTTLNGCISSTFQTSTPNSGASLGS